MAPQTRARVGRGASRLTVLGMVAVLLAVTGYFLATSWANASAAHRAAASGQLSDHYESASRAVATQESLERKYRLEPGPAVRTRYAAAAAALTVALARVRADGTGADVRLVDLLLAQHARYLRAISGMFDAVDRGDAAAVLRIDGTQVDPLFDVLEARVDEAAAGHRTQSLADIEQVRRQASATLILSPVVLVSGFVLVLGFASLLRRFRREIDLAAAQAVHESLHDALTGLPNRVLLADRIEQALRADRRAGTASGLLLIDLDRFKDINDTLGHQYGDQLLAQMGPRLVAAVREVDTVARLGGDEFAVLLAGVSDVDSAVRVAQDLQQALAAPFHLPNGIELEVEASIGVVLSDDEDCDGPVMLLQRADVAMYVAKQQNLGVFAYTPDVDVHSLHRLSLLGDLRRGLDRRELVLHYQPKIGLSTGAVVGVEALVRWDHPQRGRVQPDEFVPLAEHTGLIGPLTRYVLAAAVTQARVWCDAGRALPIAVNLSARNLLDDELADDVQELLARHGVPVGMLELEVTESAIMIQPQRAQRMLRRLRAQGLRLSVDDFGSGYTSLAQLTALPITEVKVDRSFVLTMASDPGNALIVRSVIELAHNLGLTAVAEGVETEEALARLTDFGCDVAQGYLLGRPMPAEDFDAWFAERSAGAAGAPVRA